MQLAAYLPETLKAQFYMYSLDTDGPRSKYLVQSEIIFETNTCPAKLVGVHRIYWKREAIL
ncbi:hypothetical protein PybrP1_006930, partial [[Pythium] brassicae (nom. inval.)]